MADNLTGLTADQVASRCAGGLVNHIDNRSSRRLIDILRANLFTPFNGLITSLALVVILVNKSPINSLFFIAMLVNIIVGVGQELKAKLILDRLSIITKPRALVIREGRQQEVDSRDIVQDDLIKLKLGDQILVDGEVLQASNFEVDESLLTGEVDPIVKIKGKQVLSGSIVVAGEAIIRATAIGNQSYSAKLARETKQFKRASSELIAATNQLMKWIARIMIVVAPILIIGQLRISQGNWQQAVIHTVAAIVGMIPEGLVLLTSAAFMLATIKLARQKVLVQQLPAVETLARVDTILLDKTGTLTTGLMQVDKLTILREGFSKKLACQLLATFASRADSPTNQALTNDYRHKPLAFGQEVSFSSARKWSALAIDGHYYVLGAPEIVLPAGSAIDKAEDMSSQGLRVLALVELTSWPSQTGFDSNLSQPILLVSLVEQLRPSAQKTLNHFANEGVAIKIISGDSPLTVGSVAQHVGLEASTFDARKLPDPVKQPDNFLTVIEQHNVFGRVLPEQKRQIAAALQSVGRVVAMTGDGVNDALALKKSDIGIAMESGSNATKAVAEVILMDNDFTHLASVLAEGRRVAANIERAANLFLIKNTYVAILALATTTLGLTYPFLPAQMTVISVLSIGLPAFFLALAPNYRPYKPGFLKRVLWFSLPTGAITAVAMIASYYLIQHKGMTLSVSGTSVSIVAMLIGLSVLIYLARPVKIWKLGLVGLVGLCFAAYIYLPALAPLFSLQFDPTTLPVVFLSAGLAVASILVVQYIVRQKRRS